MTLMILAGVWALAFGYLTLTSSVKMKGNDARVFGFISILVAAFVLPTVAEFINGYAPSMIAANEALQAAFDMLIGAGLLYVTAWVTSPVIPKLRIPSVTVSVKRSRN